MKHVQDVVAEYDPSDKTEQKKILLLEWFQKYPGQRFDLAEVHQELGDELDIGRARTRQILKELEDESVLESYGVQRTAYELSGDILIPVKYQVSAGLRHLWTVVDVKRWGVTGVFVICTIIWLFLTLPFWFFSILLVISPYDQIGPLTQPEIIVVALSMTIWLLAFIICISTLQMIQSWWNNRTTPE